MGPGIRWDGVNGCFVSGPIFGTAAVGSVNGLIGSFAVFGDLVNVESNFAGGFTSDANFDQIASADLDDSNAPMPYGVGILQRSYTNTGEEYAFIRYGFVNMSGDDLTDFYAGIFTDWDIDSVTFGTNSGGYDLVRDLIWQRNQPPTNYFGIAALDGLSGGRTTTMGETAGIRDTSFAWITTFNTTIDPNGDFRSWVGTGPRDMAPGDTSWVTFAIVAGNNLGEMQGYADAARAKAIAVGFIKSTGADDQDTELPAEFALSQNYPNPFNPSTLISFALPEQAGVTLRVYNLLGQEVVTLADEVREAGNHEVVWNGRNSFGRPVSSGMYFYRLEATGTSGKSFTDLKKMLLIK
jgi:hypothetical protein